MLCRQPGKWHISSHSITRILALHQNVSLQVSNPLRRAATVTRPVADGNIAFSASNVPLQPPNHVVTEKQCQEAISNGSPATDVLHNRENERPEWLSQIMTELLAGKRSPYVRSLTALLNGPKPWFETLSDERAAMFLAEYLAFTGRTFLASQVLVTAVNLGAQLRINSFEKTVHRLAKAKQWRQVLYFVHIAPQFVGRQSRRLLNWRAQAYVEKEDYTRLDEILPQFAIAGFLPSHRTFLILIRGHLQNHDLKSAKRILQEMKDADFPIDAETYSTIVSGYRGLGRDSLVQDHALDVAKESKGNQAVSVLNSLLRLCFTENDSEGVRLILRLFDRNLSRFGNSTEADGEQLDEASISPDVVTYTILVTFLAKKQDLQWLLALIEHMGKTGITIDEMAAAALIKAFFALGAEGSAVKLLCDIYRLHMDAKDFCSRWNICQSQRSFNNVSCEPSVIVYNAFLEGALSSHGLDVVPDVLEMMHQTCVKPDVRTCEIIMTYMSRLENARPKYFIKFVRLLKRLKTEPSLRIVFLFLNSLHRRDKSRIRGWDALAASVKGRVKETNRPLSINLSSTLEREEPDPLLGLSLSDENRSYFNYLTDLNSSLHDRSILADRSIYSLRMQHETLSKDKSEVLRSAKRTFQEMSSQGLHPTPQHYIPLMEAYVAAGDIRGARILMRECIEGGMRGRPAVAMHTVLIRGYARSGRPDMALHTFQDMLRADIAPDPAAIHAVVGAFFAVGAYRLARRVLLELWPMVAPFPEELAEASLRELAEALRKLQQRYGDGAQRLDKHSISKVELRGKLEKIVSHWKSLAKLQKP